MPAPQPRRQKVGSPIVSWQRQIKWVIVRGEPDGFGQGTDLNRRLDGEPHREPESRRNQRSERVRAERGRSRARVRRRRHACNPARPRDTAGCTRVEDFCRSVADMLEAWIERSKNANTRRTYRRAVENFIEFLGIDWSRRSHELLSATVPDVRAWRDKMAADGRAPSTLNSRLSALSAFYRFMREISVTELRLPIQVPNPAHAQFIGRESSDPASPTSALTLSKAKRLLALPSRDFLLREDAFLAKRYEADPAALEHELDVLVTRDRSILATFLYTGARIGSVCALHVADFHDDEDDPTLRFREKGRSRSKRRIGINFVCTEALRDYLERAELSSGPMFRARANPRSAKLSSRAISQAAMYRLLLAYLSRLPGGTVQEEMPDGTMRTRCRYSPHSLRATTATLLDEAGVPIKRIQELLGHKDIRVTQAYIKLLRDARKSASHDMPL